MAGARTRTGCFTCRRRRVKCDEGKPLCSRCSNANVVCAGYPGKRRIFDPSASFPQPQTASFSTEPGPKSMTSAFQHQRALSSSALLPTPVPFPSSESRYDHLSAYHFFVTCSVHQVFRSDQMVFWRDEVARMSWTIDVVYEAISAVGAMERANMLTSNGRDDIEVRRSRVFAYQAYHRATHLLAGELRRGIRGQETLLVAVLVLLVLFECSVGNAHIACQHLWAAIQLLRDFSESADTLALVQLRESIVRLDFLAQSIMPYGRSSYFRAFAFKPPLMERPFYSNSGLDLDAIGSSQPPDPVSLQHLSLLRLISAHNDIDKIVWCAFYGQKELPLVDQLLSFHADLLQWRANSQETFSAYEDLSLPLTPGAFDDLPIPPEPVFLQRPSTAIAIAYYNCYMACTLSMLAVTETDQDYRDARELEAFALTYQNLRLAAGFLAQDNLSHIRGAAPPNRIVNRSTQLDPSTTIALFLGARRCFKAQWYDWTIFALRHLGRSGLCDGRALASCLQILDGSVHHPISDKTLSPLGRLDERTVPILMPISSENGMREAFYLRQKEGLFLVEAKATWRHREQGLPEDQVIEHFHHEEKADQGLYLTEPTADSQDPLKEWKQSLEQGWHTFVNQPQQKGS